jgi:hypothetical protein
LVFLPTPGDRCWSIGGIIISRGIPKLLGRYFPQCQFVYHKSHMGTVEVEHKPAHYKVNDYLSCGCKNSLVLDGGVFCLDELMKIAVDVVRIGSLEAYICTQDLPNMWMSSACHSTVIFTNVLLLDRRFLNIYKFMWVQASAVV